MTDPAEPVPGDSHHIVSDSEEENSDEPNQYELDDFLVDEADDGDEEQGGSGSDDHEPRSKEGDEDRSTRKKKRKPQSYELDEDDLALIEENIGKRKRKLRRLKKRTDDSAAELGALLDENTDVAPARDSVRIPEEDWDSDDDLRGFLVDYDDEGKEIQAAPRRKAGRRSGVSRFSQRQLEEANAMFGDVGDYFDDEDMANEQGQEEVRVLSSKDKLELYKKQYEPSTLAERFLTETDELVRTWDIPEILQKRFASGELATDLSLLTQEAEWIFEALQSKNRQPMDARVVIPRILTVLQLLRKEKLEQAYVAMYKKECYVPELSVDDLWRIYELDERWEYLLSRKEVLLELHKKAGDVPKEYMYHLKQCKSETEVKDMYDHFQLLYPEVLHQQTNTKYKRPMKRDFYSIASQNHVVEFAKIFGITAREFGENFINGFVNQPEDRDDEPESAALQFLNDHRVIAFGTADEVLKAARHVLALQIATDPLVRQHARNIYMVNAKVSTMPTEKGSKDIDLYHVYRGVKWLKSKPVLDFADEQFLDVLRAEKENFITVTIGQDEGEEEDMLGVMQEFYLSYGTSDSTKKWNEQRDQILKSALLEHLCPLFNTEIREKLKTEAEERVIRKVCDSLTKRLQAGPPLKPERLYGEYDDEERDMCVLGCIWGGQDEKTQIVVVDENGELVEHLQLAYINNRTGPRATQEEQANRDKDMESLYTLIKTVRPAMIAVGASLGQVQSRRFFSALRVASGDASADLEEEGGSMPVEYFDTKVARIFGNSSRALKEFPEYPTSVRQAISLARYVMDPLTELASLCNPEKEILCLHLHELQGLVNQELLLSRIDRCFREAVASVGVDINKQLLHPWAASTLQFVPGLGPRKADFLLQILPRKYNVISSRDLLDDVLPRHENDSGSSGVVYTNCAAYVRIRQKYLISYAAADEYDVLDDTRIHPDDYGFARKMAADALDSPDDERKWQQLVEDVMDKPDTLESIDLETFADEWQRRSGVNKLHTLYLIKSELQRPFADMRKPLAPLEIMELLYTLTGESPQTLCCGQLVTVRISRLLRDKALVMLENGLQGEIDVMNLSDNPPLRPEELVVVGQVIPAKILDVHATLDLERWTVFLTSKGSDLANPTMLAFNADPYLEDDTLLTVSSRGGKESTSEKKKKRKNYLARVVKHPLFQAVGFKDAEDLLADMEPGEEAVVIRPSSKGWDHLTVTWKFHDDVYVHTDVTELEKEHPKSLGKVLEVDGQRYEDLDEIIARYVTPVAEYAQSMREFRKFRSGDKESLYAMLRQAREENPESIPYFIGIADKFPGKFQLCYMPSSRPRTEYITTTPDGFRFRKQYFKDVERLLRYFKKHYADIRPIGRDDLRSSRSDQGRSSDRSRPNLSSGSHHTKKSSRDHNHHPQPPAPDRERYRPDRLNPSERSYGIAEGSGSFPPRDDRAYHPQFSGRYSDTHSTDGSYRGRETDRNPGRAGYGEHRGRDHGAW